MCMVVFCVCVSGEWSMVNPRLVCAVAGGVGGVVPRLTRQLLPDIQAISHPKDEVEQAKAWDSVCPLVKKLKSFYDYSSEVEKMLPLILQELCQEDPCGTLERKQVCLCAYIWVWVWVCPSFCSSEIRNRHTSFSCRVMRCDCDVSWMRKHPSTARLALPFLRFPRT